jgi:hypothetical protein
MYALEFTPGFKRGSCCSIFSFLCTVFCISLFFSFFFWPLYCLSFFDLRLLVIPFGILSQTYLRYLQTFLHICCYICWMVITTTIVWHLYIDLHMSCTTKGVSSIFARAVVYSIQLWAITFVGDFLQVGDCHGLLSVPPPVGVLSRLNISK